MILLQNYSERFIFGIGKLDYNGDVHKRLTIRFKVFLQNQRKN
jgi:hypothetical protein